MNPAEFQNIFIQWATTIVAVLITVCGLLAKFLPIFAELRAKIDALKDTSKAHSDAILSLNEQTTMLGAPLVAPVPPDGRETAFVPYVGSVGVGPLPLVTAGRVKIPSGGLINTMTPPPPEYEQVAAKPDQGITN